MELIDESVTLTNDILGRQAANFTYKIITKSYNVWIVKDERSVNAKSILGLLSLNLKSGETVIVKIDSKDTEELKEICNLINE